MERSQPGLEKEKAVRGEYERLSSVRGLGRLLEELNRERQFASLTPEQRKNIPVLPKHIRGEYRPLVSDGEILVRKFGYLRVMPIVEVIETTGEKIERERKNLNRRQELERKHQEDLKSMSREEKMGYYQEILDSQLIQAV